MSIVSTSSHNSAPSENWDDDFDFQHQSGSPKRRKNAHDNYPNMTRMSTTTEDWDAGDTTSATPFANYDPTRPAAILIDKLSIATPNLQDWVEGDPCTPQKSSFPADIATENWDDDFLDKRDSPARPSTNTPSKNSITKKLRVGVPLYHRKISHHSDEEEHESWDDEFDFNQSPAKPSTPGKQPRPPRRPSRHLKLEKSSSSRHQHHDISDDDDGDAADFGRASNEEDRTVTACSKRAPQVHSPPPPVPAIPFALTPLLVTNSTGTNAHLNAPFSRSPTTSVFSVPTPSIADTTSLRSTAPLRPSLSRNPGTNALKHLPPSPPIHRERRRLRKKSRPQPQGMIELLDMSPVHFLSDTEADLRIEECDERRTPSPPPAAANIISASVPQTPSQSQPGTSGALLSRIGSVKRWTTRRKRGSTTPSEAAKDGDKGKDTDNVDDHQTPRPHPSLSSLLLSSPTPAPPPPPSSSWFFRSSSPNQGHVSLGGNNATTARSSFTGSRSGSMTDLSMRGSIYASSSIYGEDEHPVQRTPNKLVKRKSLSFVQLKKGLRAKGQTESGKAQEGSQDPESSDVQKPSTRRPVSMQGHGLPSTVRQAATQRHASYGVPKVKKPDASTDDLHENRVQPALGDSRLKSQALPKGERRGGEGLKGKDKEAGSRGFMGSVRRLSLTGRHKRTKSGASLVNMEVLTRVPSESSAVPSAPLESARDSPPSLPPSPAQPVADAANPQALLVSVPALLPPIELQPPSPPRNKTAAINFSSNPLQGGVDSMLSPASPSASAPALAMPASSKSPKSPESTRSRTPHTPKSPASPQSASLGRATPALASASTITGSVQRRSSLNDLKSDLRIPARISQAQVGLKRDLSMVRDFAVYIEKLKGQQEAYHGLVTQVQQKLDAQARLHAQQPAARAVSPSFFNNLSRPKTRARSNTNPGHHASQGYKELAAAFYTINSKYRISWECAELLVELADGSSGASGFSPPSSASAPMTLNTKGEKRNRERAITLAGDESKPPTPTPGASSSLVHPNSVSSIVSPLTSPNAWRASTGRHDLSHRQLTLLREMLNNAEAMLFTDEPGFPLPEESAPSEPESSGNVRVNRDWRWGDPMSSTVTLPPGEQSGESPKKKRRTSRLGMGMSGLRDILRALKKSNNDTKDQNPPPLPTVHNHAMLSTASLSTDTSLGRRSGGSPPDLPPAPRKTRPKSSAGPEPVVKPGKERGRAWEPKEPSPPPYGRSSLAVKPSTRRPSLASIFRLGTRKNAPPSASVTDLSMHSCDRHPKEDSRPATSLGSIQGQSSSTGEEDWDRMDSASDLDAAARALEMNMGIGIDGDGGATVRMRKGRSPYLQHQAPSSSGQLGRPTTPRRSASGSQLLLRSESPSKAGIRSSAQPVTPRATRLSNVDEGTEGSKSRDKRPDRRRSSSRASGKIVKSGSVRSMPPQPVFSDLRIAMTPENIKPLLENAKEVHTRLGDCITEIQRLLESDRSGERSVSGSSYTSGQSCVS